MASEEKRMGRMNPWLKDGAYKGHATLFMSLHGEYIIVAQTLEALNAIVARELWRGAGYDAKLCNEVVVTQAKPMRKA